MLSADQCDLIVLDDDLPDMTAALVISGLRAQGHAPVILLTARTDDEDIVAEFSPWVAASLAKPFSAQLLINRVKAVLRWRGIA